MIICQRRVKIVPVTMLLADAVLRYLRCRITQLDQPCRLLGMACQRAIGGLLAIYYSSVTMVPIGHTMLNRHAEFLKSSCEL